MLLFHINYVTTIMLKAINHALVPQRYPSTACSQYAAKYTLRQIAHIRSSWFSAEIMSSNIMAAKCVETYLFPVKLLLYSRHELRIFFLIKAWGRSSTRIIGFESQLVFNTLNGLVLYLDRLRGCMLCKLK